MPEKTPDEILDALIDEYAESGDSQMESVVELMRDHRHNMMFEHDEINEEALDLAESILDAVAEAAVAAKKKLAELRADD